MLGQEHLRHLITDEQKREFDEQGWLAVPGALPPDLVGELEQRVDQIHHRHLAAGFDPYRSAAMGPDDNFFYPNFLGGDQLFVNLLDWPTTFPLVWGILGWNIYSYHSHLIVTPPQPQTEETGDGEAGPRRLGWHQDSLRVNRDIEVTPRPRLSLKVVYWLSDCSETGRGNLHILPGSHLLDQVDVPDDGTLPAGALAVTARPGDAVIFDRRLWHARSDNQSSITRKGLFYGYGYRWLRPKDDMAIAREVLQRNDPIRRQLLGDAVDNNGRYSPRDADVPLKGWLQEQGIPVPD